MNIKISGTNKFIDSITSFHNYFKKEILQFNNKYESLNDITIHVIESSKIDSIGLSKFESKELLINHQLTKNNLNLLHEVYGHELAHFYTTLFSKKNIQHGKKWKDLMKHLNLPPRDNILLSDNEIQSMNFIKIECDCLFNNPKTIQRKELLFDSCRRCHSEYKII